MIKKLYNKNNSPKDLDEIVALLEDGGVIIYPTDTLYAIGCHALKERAAERICRIKNIDPRKHHLSITCQDMAQIAEYAKMDNAVFKLMKQNLPGPFTFILPTSSKLPKIFRNRKEVGVRLPDHPITQAIVEALGAPLLTSTLTIEAHEDDAYLTDPELIDEKMGNEVDLVIDGGIGGLEPSTVVDCMEQPPVIVRQGKGWLEE